VSLEALVFDVDGTLADTEEAHRLAFNAAFRSTGLDWHWSASRYRELLNVAGGKERLAHFIESLGLPPSEAAGLQRRIPRIHEAKTRAYAELVSAGAVPLRTGIARLIEEAHAAGLELAIASTTTAANVDVLIENLLGTEVRSWFRVVATGDAAPNKKPAPDVYRLALEGLGCSPASCAAFEDSDLGVCAAKAAGLYTVAVPTVWTADHDLSKADLVLPALGDPDRPLAPEPAARIGAGWLGASNLAALHAEWLRGQSRRSTRS